MNVLPFSRVVAVAIAALLHVSLVAAATVAQDTPCELDPPRPVYVRQGTVIPPEPARPSWIFDRSTYTHDPYSGARVAQYMPLPAVEPLDDPRLVTSRYRRSRTNLRGIDGSVDTYYEVQQWGNGRGGLDAEWERFHDAWKESYLSGGFYNRGSYGNGSPFAGPGFGYGGYGNPGYGFPGYQAPGYGYGPGYGPGYGQAPGGWLPPGGPHPGN